MLDGPLEVRYEHAYLVVRPRLGVRRGVEPKIGPQRRADESHLIDVDDARVEQLDSVVPALAREFAPCGIDLRPVPLVVAVHVEEVRVAPRAHHIADAVRAPRGQIACEDDDVGVRGDRGEGVAPVLEVEGGEDLHANRRRILRLLARSGSSKRKTALAPHCATSSVPSFSILTV